MVTAMYQQWASVGQPIAPAQPIRDLVAALQTRYPGHANQFSWYANAAHYKAAEPQDHTPYSVDAWPIRPCPRWWVCATDVMAVAVGGAEALDDLVDYWLAEARAGRMPWLKYLIWKANIYDVRYGWKRQDSSDHFDHAHLSSRTDHLSTHLGSWSPFPTGGTVTPDQEEKLLKQVNDINYILWKGGPGNTSDFRTYFTELRAELTAQRAVIEQLAAAISAGGGTVDTAAILAGVDVRLAALRTGVEADTRDAIADNDEGGAAAVRADE